MKDLETERLLLREWTLQDASDVFDYASGAKVGPMAGWKPHDDLEETKQIIQMFIEAGDTWAIEYRQNHKVIGSIGLHQPKRKTIEFDRELGYALSEHYWGQGLIPEAADAVIAYAFNELQISTLLVSHFSFNIQSKRVIEKLGFVFHKHLDRSWKRYDGEILDEEVYLMTLEDYQKRKNH